MVILNLLQRSFSIFTICFTTFDPLCDVRDSLRGKRRLQRQRSSFSFAPNLVQLAEGDGAGEDEGDGGGDGEGVGPILAAIAMAITITVVVVALMLLLPL